MNYRIFARICLTICTVAVVQLGFVSGAAPAQQDQPAQQNSMKKIRVTPGPLAAKIGMGIEWETDLDNALAKSQQSGKPVFWYVPTVPGSFMDRKTEIDRYMMAGPFSWESTRSIINNHFIPLVMKPDAALQEKYGLNRFDFIEPGMLVLASDGQLTKKLDRITTLHPQWLSRWLGDGMVPAEQVYRETKHPRLRAAWQQFVAGEREIEIDLSGHEPTDGDLMQAGMLRGMILFRDGKHDQARQVWREMSEHFPDHPLAWKAAAEAEGFGPFVRGFEVHAAIPDSALAAGVNSPGSQAPVGIYQESEIIRRSIRYLLDNQREDGGWFDSDYDFGGTDSLPNVYVAVTALCGMALLAQRDQVPELNDEINSAIERAAQFVAQESNLNRADRDELVWALSYRSQFLARLTRDNPNWANSLQATATELVNFQTQNGGWFHEYPNAFVSGTALHALHEAQTAGAKIDSDAVQRGIKRLSGERRSNGAFPYSSGRGNPNRPAIDQEISAASGRMPICELALFRWGESDQERLVSSVDKSFDGHQYLEVALKYDDHTSVMAYGGFFFWYGMYGRSEAIAAIAAPEKRRELSERQRELVLKLPELDGCFVDSHELGRCYGTAMALLCLGLMTANGR